MLYDTDTLAVSPRAGRRNVFPDQPACERRSAPLEDGDGNAAPVGVTRKSPEPLNCDALASYFRELSRYSLLTPEEEIALAHRIRQGDESAREQMITANLRLVVKIARDFDGGGLALLDLINEGNIGLMKAVDRFDPTRGARLAAYACHWIKQAIRRALANQARTIRLPVHVHEKLLYLGRVAHGLQEKLGRAATEEEIAEESGISPERVRRFLNAAHPAVSLDYPAASEDTRRAEEAIPDHSVTSPDASLALQMDLELMRRHLPALDRREQRVLALRFGLDGHGAKTLEEVGGLIGLTRERVRQIQDLALTKLRRRMEQHDGRAMAA